MLCFLGIPKCDRMKYRLQEMDDIVIFFVLVIHDNMNIIEEISRTLRPFVTFNGRFQYFLTL